MKQENNCIIMLFLVVTTLLVIADIDADRTKLQSKLDAQTAVLADTKAKLDRAKLRITELKGQLSEAKEKLSVFDYEREQQSLRDYVRQSNPWVSENTATKIVRAVHYCSAKYKVDRRLLMSMIQQESWFDPHASGPYGEIGLMQISIPTAKDLGLDLERLRSSISYNVCAGAGYISRHLENYGGNVNRALVRYNGGGKYPGRVLRHYQKIAMVF